MDQPLIAIDFRSRCGFCLLLSCQSVCGPADPMRSCCFVGGTIVDGSGGEPFVGSVAVRDGKIVAVGELAQVSAGRTIDCQGLVICPGLHRPAQPQRQHDSRRKSTRNATCYLTQGCTTLVTGNCGGGRARRRQVLR